MSEDKQENKIDFSLEETFQESEEEEFLEEYNAS